MIFDTHMHCNNSCDSHMVYQDAIQAAESQKMGITITEHWDYNYPTNPEAFMFNIDNYFTELMPMCNEKILIGIEIGMQKDIAVDDDYIASSYDFDIVLGSIHCVNQKDIYEKNFYQNKLKSDAVKEYLTDAIICCENHNNFDTLAHIDYICRYWPYKDKEFSLKEHRELFKKLFITLINKNKPLEINTRRLNDKNAVEALISIYRYYRYLGGSYCTLGSDAHYKEHVGRRMDIALAIAKAADLVPVYFKKRKMCLMGV